MTFAHKLGCEEHNENTSKDEVPDKADRKKYKERRLAKVTEARELLDFAVSEGSKVPNTIIEDINRAYCQLYKDDRSASDTTDSLDHTLSTFDKAYRDLANFLSPVTYESLRFARFHAWLIVLLPIGLALFFVLWSWWAGSFEVHTLTLAAVFTISLPFFIWFLFLFTGIIRKKRVIQIVLFCYLFTIAAISISLVPFFVSDLSKYRFMRESPIGILVGCNEQASQEWIPKEIQCGSREDARPGIAQWIINIGGAVEESPSARAPATGILDQEVKPGDDAIHYVERDVAIAKGDWLWIGDGDQPDLVRVESARANSLRAMAADVRVGALRFSHGAGTKIRRAEISPAGSLAGNASAQATTVRLDEKAAELLARGDWIWIQGDAGKQEAGGDLVQIVSPVAVGEDVRIEPPMRFAHEAQREVAKVTVAENHASDGVTGSVVIQGGIVVPLYVVFLSLVGGAVSMTRRVPEYQKRIYLREDMEGYLPRESARELLVLQIMQVLSAPLIAITAYYGLSPDNPTGSVALGFASGFASETILRAISALVEKMNPVPSDRSGRAAAEEKEASPAISSINPSRGSPGDLLKITVTGTGFQKNASVSLADNKLESNIVDSTKIECSLDLPPDTKPGPRDFVVTNPDGKKSNTLIFQVKTPGPKVSEMHPAAGSPGETVPVTVVGSGFQEGAIVELAGTEIRGSELKVEGAKIECSLELPPDTKPGPRDFVVTNPDGERSNALIFQVKEPT